MGTDVYLRWNRQAKEEMEKQHEGIFSIDQGNIGYLRASIHMVDENTVLRMIFPDEYWQGGDEMEYDFNRNYKYLKPLLNSYMKGEEIDIGDRLDGLKKLSGGIIRAFENQGLQVRKPEPRSIQGRVIWAKSLIQFFRLGIKLQKEGMNPRICILW